MDTYRKEFIADVEEKLAHCFDEDEKIQLLEILNNAKDETTKWFECGFCYGAGKVHEYENTWTCNPCLGLGGHFA